MLIYLAEFLSSMTESISEQLKHRVCIGDFAMGLVLGVGLESFVGSEVTVGPKEALIICAGFPLGYRYIVREDWQSALTNGALTSAGYFCGRLLARYLK